MNTKRRMAQGTLAAALLAAAGLAWAQAPTTATAGSQAQMTDEQARQLDELRGRYEEKMRALESRLDAAERRFDAALRRPEADTDQIIALRRERRDLEGQLEDLGLRADADAARLLGQPPGATLDRTLGHHRWQGWDGPCSWGRRAWDGAWHGGDRATPWWRSWSWLGRGGSRAGWRSHCR